jgi:hypothetical protein
MDSNPLFLTGNTDTVYCMVMLDLEADGPTVVEIPPGSGPGTVNDAFFRFVVDMGPPGPDQGKGGKYLIVPPGFKGELPSEGYFVARSTSYVNWVPLRGFLKDGKPDAASNMFRNGVKVYPLSKAGSPPAMQFINGSKAPVNTIFTLTTSSFTRSWITSSRRSRSISSILSCAASRPRSASVRARSSRPTSG